MRKESSARLALGFAEGRLGVGNDDVELLLKLGDLPNHRVDELLFDKFGFGEAGEKALEAPGGGPGLFEALDLTLFVALAEEDRAEVLAEHGDRLVVVEDRLLELRDGALLFFARLPLRIGLGGLGGPQGLGEVVDGVDARQGLGHTVALEDLGGVLLDELEAARELVDGGLGEQQLLLAVAVQIVVAPVPEEFLGTHRGEAFGHVHPGALKDARAADQLQAELVGSSGFEGILQGFELFVGLHQSASIAGSPFRMQGRFRRNL